MERPGRPRSPTGKPPANPGLALDKAGSEGSSGPGEETSAKQLRQRAERLSQPAAPMTGTAPAPAAAMRPTDLRPVIPLPPPPLPPPDPRRRALVARANRNLVLTMYAEGWRQRIELNAAVEALNLAKSAPHADPVVTVAVRSDGSIESIVFDRASGVPEIDDAIRRIVVALAPYAAFPPDLANDYDVIEIRRVWTFETALRLFAGGR